MKTVALILTLAGIAWALVAPVPAGAHVLRYDGTISGDVAEGHAHMDDMFGYQGDDTLYGWDDADYLRGGEDFDELYGGQGADILVGGKGVNVLWGGKGNDFLLQLTSEPGIPHGFRCGEGYDWVTISPGMEHGRDYLAFGCEQVVTMSPDPPPRVG